MAEEGRRETGERAETAFPVWYWLCGAAALIALVGLLFVDDAPAGRDAPSGDCEVTGRVTDRDGDPVTAFDLRIVAASGRAAPRKISVREDGGTFGFSLPHGTFTISCTADGRAPFERTVTIAARTFWIPITLERR
jgi:hypothetical protein